MSRAQLLGYLLLGAIALVLVASPVRVSSQSFELAGRHVAAELVAPDSQLPLSRQHENVQVRTVTVITRPDSPIRDLLKANGVLPNLDAYTLVYDLNPQLLTIDPLPNHIALVIPAVVVNPGNAPSQNLAMLSVDPELKTELEERALVLRDLVVQFAGLPPARFSSPEGRTKTLSNLNDLSEWFQFIRTSLLHGTGRALRRDSLLDFQEELSFLNGVLSKTLSGTEQLSAADEMQVESIHADVSAEIEKYDETMLGWLPVADPEYRVIVEIRGKDTQQISMLRVYYVIKGEYRYPITDPPVHATPFLGIGSGCARDLAIKNYKLWVARDGDPTHPLSPVLDLPVRTPSSGTDIPVVLTISDK